MHDLLYRCRIRSVCGHLWAVPLTSPWTIWSLHAWLKFPWLFLGCMPMPARSLCSYPSCMCTCLSIKKACEYTCRSWTVKGIKKYTHTTEKKYLSQWPCQEKSVCKKREISRYDHAQQKGAEKSTLTLAVHVQSPTRVHVCVCFVPMPNEFNCLTEW